MEQENFENEEVLRENQKYFNFYLVLPTIVTVVIAVLVFIGGCFAASIADGAGILLVWLLGLIVCLLVYYLMKVSLSYNILHIYYLKKIAEKGENKTEEKTARNEPKKEIWLWLRSHLPSCLQILQIWSGIFVTSPFTAAIWSMWT
jgi:hypothetical protein